MSVSLTQSNSASTAGVTSQAVTLSSTLASGDLIIVAGRWGNQSGTITASDGPGTTYTHITGSPKSDGVSGGNEAFLMWGILGSGQSSLTVTVSVSGGGSHTLTAAVFDYASTTGWPASPVETQTTNSSTNSANTGTSGNITTSNTDLIFATIETSGAFTAASASVSAPFTTRGAGGTSGDGYASVDRAFGGDDQNASASNYNCTFNWTGTLGYAAIIAAFTPASVVPPFEDDSFNPAVTGMLVQPFEPIISVF